MFTVGPNEILLLVALGVLLFGASKIPEIARNLGRTRVEFVKGEIEAKRELEEMDKENQMMS